IDTGPVRLISPLAIMLLEAINVKTRPRSKISTRENGGRPLPINQNEDLLRNSLQSQQLDSLLMRKMSRKADRALRMCNLECKNRYSKSYRTILLGLPGDNHRTKPVHLYNNPRAKSYSEIPKPFLSLICPLRFLHLHCCILSRHF